MVQTRPGSRRSRFTLDRFSRPSTHSEFNTTADRASTSVNTVCVKTSDRTREKRSVATCVTSYSTGRQPLSPRALSSRHRRAGERASRPTRRARRAGKSEEWSDTGGVDRSCDLSSSCSRHARSNVTRTGGQGRAGAGDGERRIARSPSVPLARPLSYGGRPRRRPAMTTTTTTTVIIGHPGRALVAVANWHRKRGESSPEVVTAATKRSHTIFRVAQSSQCFHCLKARVMCIHCTYVHA